MDVKSLLKKYVPPHVLFLFIIGCCVMIYMIEQTTTSSVSPRATRGLPPLPAPPPPAAVVARNNNINVTVPRNTSRPMTADNISISNSKEEIPTKENKEAEHNHFAAAGVIHTDDDGGHKETQELAELTQNNTTNLTEKNRKPKLQQERQKKQHGMPSQEGILVMVMGEAGKFQRWLHLWNRFLIHETEASIAFDYTSNKQDDKITSSSLSSSTIIGSTRRTNTSCNDDPGPTQCSFLLPMMRTTRQRSSSSFFLYASYDAPTFTTPSSAVNVISSANSAAGDNNNETTATPVLHDEAISSSNITLGTNTSSSSSSRRSGSDTSCRTIFIPGTTWTQGRNKLVREALELERRRGQKYDYWLFLDDDIVFDCFVYNQRALMDSKTNKESICWNEFMDVLKDRTLVPQKATTVTVPRRQRPRRPYRAASNADAMVAAFKREYVPYLLPYAHLNQGESQWTSQGVLYCVMWNCFKQSAYFTHNITARNDLHRPYTRGWNISTFQAATAYNYGQYMPLHHRCDDEKHYRQKTDVVYASSVEELDALIPASNPSCGILKHRFLNWVQQESNVTISSHNV